MNGYDCDTVRDILPLLGRNGLARHERTLAQEHLAGCADCRDEAAVVRLIQTTLEPLPDGLESRVLAAVRDAVPARSPAGRSPRQWSRRQLAMAATVAAALIGGSLVIDRFGGPWMVEMRGNGPDTDLAAISMQSWAAADDPMLYGGTTLHELTMEELEQLLEELDS